MVCAFSEVYHPECHILRCYSYGHVKTSLQYVDQPIPEGKTFQQKLNILQFFKKKNHSFCLEQNSPAWSLYICHLLLLSVWKNYFSSIFFS